MKIKVKEGSSIYKLATYWGADPLPSNFCDLFRNVVWCFLVTSVVVSGLSSWIGCVLATIAASISVGYIIWSAAFVIFSVILALIVVVTIGVLGENHLRNNPSQRLDNAKLVYRSWKDKFCPLVEKIK